VRTICPGEGCREHPKKQKCRCGNGSVAAAFLWPDSEKALKSRAFRQKEKVGNFYHNYLPLVRQDTGNHTNRRFLPPSGGGCKVGADYENHLASSFFAEYIQLGVVVVLQLC
jgi:hypothetical protein